MDLAQASHPNARLTWFQFRGLNPMIGGQKLTLCGQPSGEKEAALWILNEEGRRCMEGNARFG
jgi:hydroxyacyl-ACP dehydratase HTD2-like protein with hotdog domain